MKKTIHLRWSLPVLAINAAVVIFSSGCASPDQHSFNSEFGENLPTEPKFYIKDEDDQHFRITVHQGKPSNGDERVSDVKQAATTVAKAEAQRLGWEKWHLNYIQEREQGWMHVVIAEVDREKYTVPTFPQSTNNNQ
jgi:hypothetical protein